MVLDTSALLAILFDEERLRKLMRTRYLFGYPVKM
jgi:uncharacterized protein with PIN domain